MKVRIFKFRDGFEAGTAEVVDALSVDEALAVFVKLDRARAKDAEREPWHGTLIGERFDAGRAGEDWTSRRI